MEIVFVLLRGQKSRMVVNLRSICPVLDQRMVIGPVGKVFLAEVIGDGGNVLGVEEGE